MPRPLPSHTEAVLQRGWSPGEALPGPDPRAGEELACPTSHIKGFPTTSPPSEPSARLSPLRTWALWEETDSPCLSSEVQS